MRDMSEPTTRPRLRPVRLPRTKSTVPGPGPRPRCGSGSMALAVTAAVLVGLLHALPARAIEFGEGELQGSHRHHALARRDLPGRKAQSRTGLRRQRQRRQPQLRPRHRQQRLEVHDRPRRRHRQLRRVRPRHRIHRLRESGRDAGTHRPLSDAAKDRVGQGLSNLLDAYVTGTFDAGRLDCRRAPRPARAELGGEHVHPERHQRAINPFDVSRLRTAGLGATRGAGAGRA